MWEGNEEQPWASKQATVTAQVTCKGNAFTTPGVDTAPVQISKSDYIFHLARVKGQWRITSDVGAYDLGYGP